MSKPRTAGKGWRFMRDNEIPSRVPDCEVRFKGQWIESWAVNGSTVKFIVDNSQGTVSAYRRRLKPPQ